jgi:hypothetical protein
MNDTHNVVVVEKRQENTLLTTVSKESFDVVEKIKNLTLLTPQDGQLLEKAKSFIVSTYTDVPEYRPLVIKMAAVLNDAQFPTPDSKFWQCKKEAEVHFNNLVTELYKVEKSLIDIEELDYVIASQEKCLTNDQLDKSIDPIKMGFETRRLKVKREEYIFHLKKLEKTIKYRIQEIVEWSAISEYYEKSCKYNVKKYNDHITEDLFKALQIKINNASGDDEKNNFVAQLATLKRLISEHSNQK